MKKVIRFDKFFIPAVVLSGLFIVAGLVTFATRGFNLGLDFSAGLIEEVRIASPAINIKYSGAGNAAIEVSQNEIVVILTGATIENSSHHVSFAENKTVSSVADALNKINGIVAEVASSGDSDSSRLFSDVNSGSALSASTDYPVYVTAKTEKPVTVDSIQGLLANDFPEVAVKQVGDPEQLTFQVKIPDDGTDPAISETARSKTAEALTKEFGEGNFAITKADFIGAQFSRSLIVQVFILIFATILLIWVYATIRFKWDFALGSIVAITHDVLIMVSFLAFTQIEVVSIIIAAILTILGYSINDTIVVLDRIRENSKNPNLDNHDIKTIMNLSQSEMLSRTIITTVTTMFAVLSLFIFTSGSMKDFALILMVGMISGAYSTIFISSAVIVFIRGRKGKKGSVASKTKTKITREETSSKGDESHTINTEQPSQWK
ncbi:MAG: protein translocase subunit SecF [Spirochaetaceae bacterium]|nr:protein translocase subunit SecF [Spirochaetaceae bacterium]